MRTIQNRDHPRVCGEKLTALVTDKFYKGSPPRVRGKERFGQFREGGRGITPACAGKSPGLPWSPGCSRDHPRVCGEKRTISLTGQTTQGSPPRVRGKGDGRGAGGVEVGITPACAGKSTALTGAGILTQDHPRVCGEKWSTTYYTMPVRGSPPRVRGKARPRWAKSHIPGITPACAGKSHPAILF